MAAPPKEGGTYTPDRIAEMAKAVDVAMLKLGHERSAFSIMPEVELRRRLATLVLALAGDGVAGVEQLARIALHSLRQTAPSAATGETD